MSEGFQRLRFPQPLTAEDAYWHACTGTEYVPRVREFVWDRYNASSRIYFLAGPRGHIDIKGNA